MSSERYKAAIFDMDGTILDTAEDPIDAVNCAMELRGRRHDFTKEHGCRFFGSGVKAALRRAPAFEKRYSHGQILTMGTPDRLCLVAADEAPSDLAEILRG